MRLYILVITVCTLVFTSITNLHGQFYSQSECACLSNQTTPNNGQFEDIITVHSNSDEEWTVIKSNDLYQRTSLAPPALPTPISVGTLLEKKPGGKHQLIAKRLNKTNWSLTIGNGSIERTLTNFHFCEYTELLITDIKEGCVNDLIDLNYNASTTFVTSQEWSVSHGQIIGSSVKEQVQILLPSDTNNIINLRLSARSESNEFDAGTYCNVSTDIMIKVKDDVSCQAALPITYETLSIRKRFQKAILEWKVSHQVNNQGWEIQKLAPDNTWEVLDFVDARPGQVNYTYNDKVNLLSGINVYRLKQVDFDEGFEFSELLKIYGEESKALVLYPNPSTGFFKIQGEVESDIEILNMKGQRIHFERFEDGVQIAQIPGIYLVKITSSGKTISKKLQINP